MWHSGLAGSALLYNMPAPQWCARGFKLQGAKMLCVSTAAGCGYFFCMSFLLLLNQLPWHWFDLLSMEACCWWLGQAGGTANSYCCAAAALRHSMCCCNC